MEDGKCVGVRAVDKNGEEIEARAKGRHRGHRRLRQQRQDAQGGVRPGSVGELLPLHVPGTNGEGLNMMWEAGAAKYGANIEMIYQLKDNLDHFMLDACLRQPALLVNQRGKRFLDEGQMGKHHLHRQRHQPAARQVRLLHHGPQPHQVPMPSTVPTSSTSSTPRSASTPSRTA